MAEHHERLAELAEAAGVERQAQRTLERELADAKAGLADLRDQLVSALADEDQPKAKQLAAKRAKREQAVEALGLRVDAAEQRAERASRARAEYHRDHAEDLIAELEPDAIAVGNELVESARALIAAEQRWRDLSQQTDTHLAAHPRANPAQDGAPPIHGFEPAARACRDCLNAEAPPLPLPRWQGLRQFEQQEKFARLEQLRRVERPTQAEQREKDRLCRELGVTPETVAVG